MLTRYNTSLPLCIMGTGANARYIRDIIEDEEGLQLELVDPLTVTDDQITNTEFILGFSNFLPTLYQLEQKGTKWASYVSKRSFIMKTAVLQPGSVIWPFTIICAGAQIGRCSQVKAQSNVGENTVIGNYSCVNPMSIIFGGSSIAEGTWMAARTTVNWSTKIEAKHCVIGLGSTVTKNITKTGMYLGTPAKRIKPLSSLEMTNDPGFFHIVAQ